MQTGTMDDTLGTLMAERAWLAGLARALVDDDATAEDLEQQTWLSALRHRGPIGAPRAWLATVLRNQARERARRATRRALREAEHGRRRAEDVPSSASVVEHFETQRTVAQAVADLDEPFRTTVLLHYYEGLAPSEIARREDVPAGTVRWRLFRAHELLRGRLSGDLGDERWKGALLPLCAPFAKRAGAGGVLAVAAAVLVIGSAVWLAVAALGRGEPSRPIGSERASATATPPPEAADGERVEVADSPGVAVGRATPAAASDDRGPRGDEFAVVRARFVDSDGAPVPGARLELARVGIGSFWVELDGIAWVVPPARAGGDGRTALTLRAPAAIVDSIPEPFRPRPGEIWKLEIAASANGFAPWIGPIHVGHGDDLDIGEVVLRPASRVSGRVVDGDGNAVRDAEVVVELPPLSNPSASYVDGGRVPVSDLRDTTASFFGRGRYAIDAVPRGPVVVWARKDGFRSAWRLVDVRDPDVAVEDLVLEPSPARPASVRPEFEKLVVRVVAEESGAKVTDAEVFHRAPNRGGSGSVLPDGSTTIGWTKGEGEVPEIDLIVVDRSGRLGAVRRRELDPSTGDVTIELPPARTFEVAVAGADGRPVPGFLAGWQQGEGTGYARFYRRDDDGDGVVELVVPPCDVQIFVDAPGHREHRSESIEEGGVPRRVDVALAPLAGLTGRVVAGGEAVAGASVLVLRPTDPITSHGFRAHYDSRGNWDAKSEVDGTFRLDLEEPEPLRLLVRADGLAPALSEPLDYDPIRGIDGLEIEMSEGATVEGVVRDASGRPVPRAVVALNDYLGRPITVRAGIDGSYRFEHVRPAAYELHAVPAAIADGSTMTAPLSVADDAPVRADLVVHEGETAVRDVVVDRCVLTVRLPGTIDLRGWSASLIQPYDGRTLDLADTADRERTLRLATAWTGDYLLRVRSPGGPLGTVVIEAPVTLSEGPNEFVADTVFAPFDGFWPTSALDGALALVQRRDGVSVRAPVHPDLDTGRFSAPLAPVGAVELEQRTRQDRRVLGVVEVRAPR